MLSSAETINVRLELISNVSNYGNLWNELTASGLAMFYKGDKWGHYLCKPFILVISRGVTEVPRHSMLSIESSA